MGEPEPELMEITSWVSMLFSPRESLHDYSTYVCSLPVEVTKPVSRTWESTSLYLSVSPKTKRGAIYKRWE